MSHENSETIQIKGRWYNIHGKTRKPLPPLYPFERESYDTVEEAVEAAKKRSRQYQEPPKMNPLQGVYPP